MTPDKIVAKFATAVNHFKPITEQPSDTDLTIIWEAVAPLLLQILYDETGEAQSHRHHSVKERIR